jgi:hypothetical protein
MKNALIVALEKESKRLETELNDHCNSYRYSNLGSHYRAWQERHSQLMDQLYENDLALKTCQQLWVKIQSGKAS